MSANRESLQRKRVNLVLYIEAAKKIGLDATKEVEELTESITNNYTDIEAMKRIRINELETRLDIALNQPVLGKFGKRDVFFGICIQDWEAKVQSMRDHETIDWPDIGFKIVTMTKKQALSVCEHVRVRKVAITLLRNILSKEIVSLKTMKEVRNYEMEL